LYGKVSPDNFPNVNDYRNPFIAEAMKILGYVNRFSRGVYRVHKELKENGNGEAVFDFSLITAFKVIENISSKYLEEGFGAETIQENLDNIQEHPEATRKLPRKNPETTQKKFKNYPEKIQKLSRKNSKTIQKKFRNYPETTQKLPRNYPEKNIAGN
jgi:ATP-dependent DNA helicase RecG